MEDLSSPGGGSRGLGRGGPKEAVERVFQDGAGLASSGSQTQHSDVGAADRVGVREAAKKIATDQLREIIDTTGESERIVSGCFSSYPSQPFQDDTYLTKPNAAYEWLHFHDQLSSKIHAEQDWELGSYLSSSILAFHHLFASPANRQWRDQRQWDDEGQRPQTALAGPNAHFAASEAQKQHSATLQGLQSSLSVSLIRSFRSLKDLSVELIPNIMRMMTPDIRPVTVGGSGDQAGIVSVRKGSEKVLIAHAVEVMHAVGLIFERTRLDDYRSGSINWIYRMKPWVLSCIVLA